MMRPQTIVERLDFVAKRVQGLKFTPPTQLKGGDDPCFMSCDMYYIEIKVDQSHQTVKDVIISHGNSADGISCPVLRKVLADQDFETFAKHLTGLHSIYQINTNDKKVKQRAYPALTALEADLSILYDHQRRRAGNLHDLVHKSPIGFMEPRKGGLPVKLTYFITPYDLIDTTQKSFIGLTVNNIVDKNLGLSATVEIEGSNHHKIQIKSLIMQHNSSLPSYAPFNSQNSEKLPAQFVLKLSQPFPMLNTSISQIIDEINEPNTIREYLNSQVTSSKESIISLIARQELDLNKGPFCRTIDSLKGADSESCDLKKHVYSIRLPDQTHTYHILDNYLERSDGVYVTKIPFTHPTSIPSILKVLRQQALFNFVIGSCIRRNKVPSTGLSSASCNIGDNANLNSQMPNIFDVLPVSLNSICVAFEHPSRESLATLELDIREISCQMFALDKESVCSDEFATKVLQKCWSIPVTLRSVLKKCNERRLALLEDSNKRRERELQELLSNNSSTQQGLQLKSNLKYRGSNLQSRSNTNEKSNARDLNSIAEFLSSKVNNANQSDNPNQNETNSDSLSNRTNLLKKFSCKPKVKQSTNTKNAIGNKILSQMLKRQNSTIIIDDPNLRGPTTKKVKIKNTSGESTSSDNANLAPTLATTKLITPEVANAARLMNKQTKQVGKGQAVSLSLIRNSSNKAQTSAISSTTISPTVVGISLTSNQKQPDSSAQNVKTQTNGTGSSTDVEWTRKTSINAIIDKICLGVNDDGKNDLDAPSDKNLSNSDQSRGADSLKGAPNGAKTKSRIPGGDQFAIKQGSSGGGLKLTVTKTKPSFTTNPFPSNTTATLPSTPSSQASATHSTTSTSTSISTSAASTAVSGPNSNSNLSSASSTSNNPKQSEANKIIDLGSATPSIRYTIPKISKTQASQSGNSNANSSDNSNTANSTDTNQQGDESSNPSSSGNSSTAPSSTTTKRTTSNPFNRTGSSNRNPVSSSTHPPNRSTSNPLVSAISRPSSTSNIDNHVMNRISSSSGANGNNNQQQPCGNNRPTQLPRSVNLMPHPRLQLQQSTPVNQPRFNISHHFMPSNMINQPNQPTLPLLGQPLPPQMFSLRMPQQGNLFSSNNDLNIIAANQVALLNQQQAQQQQQQVQQQQQQMLQQPQQLIQQQISVSSSSDSSGQTGRITNFQAPTSSSTPSSPTECDQAETIAPPPLIPIDSVHEAKPASPDEMHDDASDRLSIVDMVEFADGNSLVGTPKQSDNSSPMEIGQDVSSANSSMSTVPVDGENVASTSALCPATLPAPTDSGPETENVTASSQEDIPDQVSSKSMEPAVLVSTYAEVDPPMDSSCTNNDTMTTSQSPQSTVAASTQND